MKMETLIRAFGQAIGAAMAESGKFEFRADDDDSVPLSELDLHGAKADELKVMLAGSDVVHVTSGEPLAVTIESGEGAEDSLRFKLADGRLSIRRCGGTGGAAIRVTMPAPRALSVAGAGTVETDALAPEAHIAIGGSGTVRVREVRGTALRLKIGGSGRIEAAGTVETLHVSIGGSGRIAAPELDVDKADVRIGGSGHVEFASDGELDAMIGGAGDIVVHGAPRCSLKAGGAGRLRRVPRDAEEQPRAA